MDEECHGVGVGEQACGLPPALEQRFETLRVLGRGGFGVVYLVQDRVLHRRVAVKEVPFPAGTRSARRFQVEARLLAEIRHPNVLEVLSCEILPDRGFLVSEWVDGDSLVSPPSGWDPWPAMLMIADGLGVVHEAGALHRDVKPENILLTRDERPVLIDFGLALLDDGLATRLTQTGAVVGTLMTMAPELLRGEPASRRSDFYSWGVTLFYLLEARFPFTREEILALAGGGSRPELKLRRCTPGSALARVLTACLALDPAGRPASAQEIRALHEGTWDPSPPHEPSRSPVQAAPRVRQRGHPDSSTASWSRPQLLVMFLALVLGSSQLPWRRPKAPVAAPGVPLRPPSEARQAKLLPFAQIWRELEALEGAFVDTQGAPVSGDSPQRWSILEPDPVYFGQILRRLPGLTRLQEEATQEPRLLQDPETRKNLLRLKQYFEGLDLPDPLLGMGAEEEGLKQEPFPAILREGLARVSTRPPPEYTGGWVARALRRLAEAVRGFEAKDRQARGPARGLPDELRGVFQSSLGAVLSLPKALRLGTPNPSTRRALDQWLRPEARHVRLAFHAASRVSKAGSEEDLILALTFQGAWEPAIDGILRAYPGWMPIRALLWSPARGAAPGESLSTSVLRALIQEHQLRMRENLSGEGKASLRDELASLRVLWRDLCRPTGSALQVHLTQEACMYLARLSLEVGDPAGVLEALRASASLQVAWSERLLLSAAVALEHAEDPLDTSRDELSAIREAVRTSDQVDAFLAMKWRMGDAATPSPLRSRRGTRAELLEALDFQR